MIGVVINQPEDYSYINNAEYLKSLNGFLTDMCWCGCLRIGIDFNRKQLRKKLISVRDANTLTTVTVYACEKAIAFFSR